MRIKICNIIKSVFCVFENTIFLSVPLFVRLSLHLADFDHLFLLKVMIFCSVGGLIFWEELHFMIEEIMMIFLVSNVYFDELGEGSMFPLLLMKLKISLYEISFHGSSLDLFSQPWGCLFLSNL